MTSVDQNINDHTAGNYKDLFFHVTEDGTVSGAAENITGWSARWVLAPDRGRPPILDKHTDQGTILIPDPESGLVHIPLQSDETEGLEGPHFHELLLIDSEGHPYTGANGYVFISPSTA